MTRSAWFEIIAIAAIALLVAVGGKAVLANLGSHKLFGGFLGAGLVLVALTMVRDASDPTHPEARVRITRAGAYLCAAVLALIAILAPAKWVFGTTIVSLEIALVFDLISIAARARAVGRTS